MAVTWNHYSIIARNPMQGTMAYPTVARNILGTMDFTIPVQNSMVSVFEGTIKARNRLMISLLYGYYHPEISAIDYTIRAYNPMDEA